MATPSSSVAMPHAVDRVVAGVALVLLAPLLALIAVAIRATSPGPALFRQQRVGLGGRPFAMLKFRTMHVDAERRGGALTVGARDPRVTPLGAFLRRHKLDELPQLVNVVQGTMRLVGPRPEVQQFVRLYTPAQRAVLEVRPGITDPASVRFFREQELLGAADDPRRLYIDEIMPAKIALNLEYLGRRTWRTDAAVVLQTLVRASRRDG